MNPTNPIKVLIADDSLLVRRRLARLLTGKEGLEISGMAQNALDTLDQFRELQPDVVILDIQMPGGSGIDVLEQIKKEDPFCIAIMLTNYSSPEFRNRCMKIGAEFFFEKHSEFEKVAEVIGDIVHG